MQQGAVGSLAIVGGDDARLVAVNFDAPLVASWSLSGNGLIDHLVAPSFFLTATATSFSRDGLRLLVGDSGRSLVWDPTTDKEIRHLAGVEAFGWLSNKAIVGNLRGSPTQLVRYDLNDTGLDNRLTLSLDEPPRGGAGAADGSRIYVMQGDNDVWTVDVATFKRLEPTFHCDDTGIAGVSANDDGSLVAIRCPNGLVIHDGRSGRELGRIPQYTANSAFVAGGRLVAATPAGKLAVFDTKTFKAVTALAGSRGGAYRLFSSADGRLLLMEADRTVSLYDLDSGRRLGDILEIDKQDIGDATIRPDGLAMAVGGGARGIAIWDLDPAHWATAACRLAGRNLTTEEWKTYLGSLGSYRVTCPEYPAG
jgi:WD40 repeat protein